MYETGLFNLNHELTRHFSERHVRVIIGDVRDRKQIQDVFSAYHPQVIFHATAYKHGKKGTRLVFGNGTGLVGFVEFIVFVELENSQW